MAYCLLIRYTFSILGGEASKGFVDFLKSSLHHRSSLVQYEAAKALCHVPSIEESDLQPALTGLQFIRKPMSVVLFRFIQFFKNF